MEKEPGSLRIVTRMQIMISSTPTKLHWCQRGSHFKHRSFYGTGKSWMSVIFNVDVLLAIVSLLARGCNVAAQDCNYFAKSLNFFIIDLNIGKLVHCSCQI